MTLGDRLVTSRLCRAQTLLYVRILRAAVIDRSLIIMYLLSYLFLLRRNY